MNNAIDSLADKVQISTLKYAIGVVELSATKAEAELVLRKYLEMMEEQQSDE